MDHLKLFFFVVIEYLLFFIVSASFACIFAINGYTKTTEMFRNQSKFTRSYILGQLWTIVIAFSYMFIPLVVFNATGHKIWYFTLSQEEKDLILLDELLPALMHWSIIFLVPWIIIHSLCRRPTKQLN